MIKIYGTRDSRAFRCLWALEESELAHELIHVDWRTGETRTPKFLALNPNGHVPVFESDGTVLVESLAINLHIAQLVETPLTPKTPTERSAAIEWTVWAMGELEGPHDSANRDDSDVDNAQRQAALRALDHRLQARQFLIADRFTIADLNVASVLMRPKYMPHVAEYPHVSSWFRTCASRAALSRALGHR